MSDCYDCSQARRRRWHGYRAQCPGCKARSLAESPEFAESVRAQQLQPAYRHALRALFGDGWQAAHEEVKRWAEVRKEHA